MVIELDNKTFSQFINKNYVVIDFWAAWCGPCKLLSPTIDEISDEINDVEFAKINIDDYPEIAEEFNVMSIPTLIYCKNGKVIDTSFGVVSKQTILNKISVLKS